MKETEVWRDIKGYEGLYQVSNFGRVKSLDKYINSCYGSKQLRKEKVLKQGKCINGYCNVTLCQNREKKTFTVHKLVALAFVPNDNPTEKTEINHLDENKENNHVDNLCWCSHIENINYGTCKERISKSHKGKPKSEEHKRKMSKVWKGKPKYKHRKPILQYTKEGEFIREWDSITTASNELNISKGNIVNCCNGKLKSAYGFLWRYKE